MKEANNAAAAVAHAVLTHRRKAGLSRRELAEAAGVSESAIYNVEKMSSGVRLETLLRLFTILNIRMRLEGPFMDEALAVEDASGDIGEPGHA